MHPLTILSVIRLPLIALLGVSLVPGPLFANLLLTNEVHVLPAEVTFTTVAPSELESLPEDARALKCQGITDKQAGTLKRFKELQWLDVSYSTGLSDEGIRKVSSLALTGLSVSYTNIGESGLKAIGSMTTLQYLDAKGQLKWSSAAVGAISGLAQLKALALTWGQPSIDDLLTLNKLTMLEVLQLGTSVDTTPIDDLTVPLFRLPSLRCLDLTRCMGLTPAVLCRVLSDKAKLDTLLLDWCPSVTDAVLAAIPNEAPIQRLGLQDCAKLTDAAVSRIARLSRMQELDLYVSVEEQGADSVTADALAAIGQLKALMRLSLSGRAGADEAVLAALSASRTLTELHLARCTGVNSGGLGHLGALSSLRTINLVGCGGVTDVAIEQLAARKTLERVHLNECIRITNRSVAALATCPLIVLTLDNCTTLSGEGLAKLAYCGSLIGLGLSGIPSVDDSVLSKLVSLKHLESLSLANTGVTDVGLSYLPKSNSITSLILAGCSQISDEGIVALGEMKSLKYLGLSQCPLVTKSGVTWLRQQLIECHIES